MELSSVREMAAFGGKRVKGVLKEKKEPNVDAFVVVVEVGLRGAPAWVERSETTERQKRKRDEAKKRTRMAILGGRISKEGRGPLVVGQSIVYVEVRVGLKVA